MVAGGNSLVVWFGQQARADEVEHCERALVGGDLAFVPVSDVAQNREILGEGLHS